MPPILSIILATSAVLGASATILISGSKAYDEIAVPHAASGLAMIYEEAAELYRKGEKMPLPAGDNQTIARALDPFEEPIDYIDAAKRELNRREAVTAENREPPPEPHMMTGPIISLDDPWDTPFQLTVNPDGTLTATSAGPDRIHGTSDDVTSADARERQKLPHPSAPERQQPEIETEESK